VVVDDLFIQEQRALGHDVLARRASAHTGDLRSETSTIDLAPPLLDRASALRRDVVVHDRPLRVGAELRRDFPVAERDIRACQILRHAAARRGGNPEVLSPSCAAVHADCEAAFVSDTTSLGMNLERRSGER
jgi:hypothetical protein